MAFSVKRDFSHYALLKLGGFLLYKDIFANFFKFYFIKNIVIKNFIPNKLLKHFYH